MKSHQHDHDQTANSRSSTNEVVQCCRSRDQNIQSEYDWYKKWMKKVFSAGRIDWYPPQREYLKNLVYFTCRPRSCCVLFDEKKRGERNEEKNFLRWESVNHPMRWTPQTTWIIITSGIFITPLSCGFQILFFSCSIVLFSFNFFRNSQLQTFFCGVLMMKLIRRRQRNNAKWKYLLNVKGAIMSWNISSNLIISIGSNSFQSGDDNKLCASICLRPFSPSSERIS